MSSRFNLAATLLFAISPSVAFATNGYFTHGSSVKAQGMAGVSYALAHDSIKAASNPASLIALGNQVDVGMTWFTPDREASISGNGFGLNGNYSGNDEKSFLIPEAGFSRRYSDTISYGVAIYANGGMNTSYKQTPFASLGSTGPAGVDLTQLFVTGSAAYKLNEKHSVGVGVTYVYQRFAAEGIQTFAGISAAPGAVSNNGHDNSDGWGLKLGWQGQVSDDVTLALTWSSRINTGDFNEYRGLFAEQGGFDVPATYGAGFAWQVDPNLTLAGDWQFIEYSDVKSVGNLLVLNAPLGSDDGAGFGWQDINVYKLGLTYQVGSNLTLRTGISHAEQPIPSSQTLLNVLAPGVIQDHFSVGASWQLDEKQTLSVSYTRALEEEVKGEGSIPAAFGGGEADLQMSQDILGFAWQYTM